MVTWNKFHSEGSQILDVNVQNLFGWVTCGLRFYITGLYALYYKSDLLHEERITRGT